MFTVEKMCPQFEGQADQALICYTLCVAHSFSLKQFSPQDKQRLTLFEFDKQCPPMSSVWTDDNMNKLIVL